MDCKLPDSCPYSSGCDHKDVAEFCPYHRLNYNDFSSREFKRAVYLSLNPIPEPKYDTLRKDALKKLKKEDFYDPFDPKNFEEFENRK